MTDTEAVASGLGKGRMREALKRAHGFEYGHNQKKCEICQMIFAPKEADEALAGDLLIKADHHDWYKEGYHLILKDLKARDIEGAIQKSDGC